MRCATMSAPPQRHDNFQELWMRLVKSESDACIAGRVEVDQTITEVLGVYRARRGRRTPSRKSGPLTCRGVVVWPFLRLTFGKVT